MARTKIRTEDITDGEVTSASIEDATIVTGDIASATIVTGNIASSTIATGNMAVDPTNASNLSSGSVPLAQLGNVDTSGISANQDDIALLGFRVAANGSLARYNLVDQSIDAFEDASGVDASASTNEVRNAANYYSGVTPAATQAFTSDGTYTVVGVTTVDILVIAGGGGGGDATAHSGRAGAAGGGGLINIADWDVTGSASYAITIGDGGAIGTPGANGENTTVVGDTKTLTALGGGGGAEGDNTDSQQDGGSGGSGWWPGYPGASATQPADTSDSVNTYPATGKGNDGGVSGNDHPYAGGGGGAGGVGNAWNAPAPASGGIGLDLTADWGTSYGASGIFAGGGSGADYGINSSYPATGGGGVGNNTANNSGGNTGTANTGGGGGSGGDGGSGLVLVGVPEFTLDMTLISNAQTAQSAPTKAHLVLTYTNGSGTAVLGTNITADVSMDDGSTYTPLSLGASDSQGTTGGHTIVTKNDVTLTSTSGTSMRWRIKTLVQSAAMDTRIQAVSLGWS